MDRQLEAIISNDLLAYVISAQLLNFFAQDVQIPEVEEK